MELANQADMGANSKTLKKKDDLLEMKWMSVVRLKKQVMELEKQTQQLTENSVCEKCESLEAALGTGGGKNVGDGLPREPSKYMLSGHRARVTSLALHPSYSVVASAGEDA